MFSSCLTLVACHKFHSPEILTAKCSWVALLIPWKGTWIWIARGGGRARHRDLRPHKGSDILAVAFKQHQLPITRPEVAVLSNSRQGITQTKPQSVKLEPFCSSQPGPTPNLKLNDCLVILMRREGSERCECLLTLG